MDLRDYLKSAGAVSTPAYYFDTDVFARRVDFVRKELPDIPLTFSIKANPFLLARLPGGLTHVEVCSPGELQICKAYGIPGSRIIYSGVNKEIQDVSEAIEYGVDIATAESLLHVALEEEAAAKAGKKQRVILRLTSGNQFGMSEADMISVLANREMYSHLDFYGIHYYSGTQKKKRQIDKDFEKLGAALTRLQEETGFTPRLVEMGPGLPVDYFMPPYEETEEAALMENKDAILSFAKKYPLGIEMGRYLAAPCGTYATRVKDIKTNDDVHYVICDGGIHHLKYHGQTMAMQVPEMEVLHPAAETRSYCICGSLCTVADVLVREVELPELAREDVILFHRAGAYSVTEGSALFLSRQLPEVYLYDRAHGLQKVRGFIDAADMNKGSAHVGLA